MRAVSETFASFVRRLRWNGEAIAPATQWRRACAFDDSIRDGATSPGCSRLADRPRSFTRAARGRTLRRCAPTPLAPDERFWEEVRAQYVMPPGYVCLNAANLCPSPARVLDACFEGTRSVDRDPSSQNRQKTHDGREAARRTIAEFLRVTPEEIVITRNTSESNNLVSTGIDLKAGDEVLLSADNHPSNHTAWQEKAKRFGFTVKDVPMPNPHPGADHYVDAFSEGDHAADEGHRVHAPDQHGRRSVSGEGDLSRWRASAAS